MQRVALVIVPLVLIAVVRWAIRRVNAFFMRNQDGPLGEDTR